MPVHPYPAVPTRILSLKGNDYEIGRQHAEQVGNDGREGMIRFYCEFWRRLLGVKGRGPLSRSALHAGRFLLERCLVDRLIAQVPGWARERMRGCAEGAGLDADELLTVLVLPDLLPILQAYLTRVLPRRFVEAAGPPRFGCSSFISSGRAFLHGRNLDFPGVAYWDRYPVIQLTQRPGCLRTVSFTTAGVPIGGITGINEAQVSVSLHQHYGAQTSLKGALPFIIGEEILSRAKSLEDAVEILQAARVASSWAFIVTDGKQRRGLVYETHPRAFGATFLSEDRPILAHSNFFQSPECRPSEYATSCRMNWDNFWRKTRLEELVRSRGAALTMEESAAFISDHYDRYWGEEKPFNRTVSQVYNIQSLVLDPENMRVLFAEGDAPIHLGQFQEYDLGAIFSGRPQPKNARRVPGYVFQSEARKKAKQAYILSFIEAFEERLPQALEHLDRSLDHELTHEAALVAAQLHLKLGDFRRAIDRLEWAVGAMQSKMREKGLPQPPPEFFEAELYLARAYDLVGERRRAVGLYQAVASHPRLGDRNLRRLAAAEGPYTAADAARILMPYSSYIPFS
jgi:tetratricopeptide (TPR) repeat protein